MGRVRADGRWYTRLVAGETTGDNKAGTHGSLTHTRGAAAGGHHRDAHHHTSTLHHDCVHSPRRQLTLHDLK